jgi:putative two-component system response regulator
MVGDKVCLTPLGDPRRALIVDDDAGARRSLAMLLKHAGLQTAEVDSVAAARERLGESSFDIVLLDLNLPGEPGLILLSELAPRAPEVAVIVVSANANAAQAVAALKQGAYDYVCKPYQVGALLEAVEQALRRRDEERQRRSFDEELAWLVEERTKNLHDALDRLHDAESSIKRVACALAEIRDAETGSHLKRIAVYARELALALPEAFKAQHGIDFDFVSLLVEAAPLHDIGKIAVPDHILMKQGPLTPQEHEIMRQHPVTGQRILQAAGSGAQAAGASLVRMGCEICVAHHERYDGTGYPCGLEGEAIPAAARIIAVADVYDALATPRLYRPQALEHRVVRHMIVAERNQMFDPDVVDAFLSADKQMARAAQRIRDVEIVQGHDGYRDFGPETAVVAKLMGVTP